MANTFVQAEEVANAMALAVMSELNLSKYVWKDLASDPAAANGTVLVRKPATLTAGVHNGTTTTVQDITESEIPVKFGNPIVASVKVSGSQLTFDVKDFVNQVAKPAAVAIAEQVDSMVAAEYKNIPNFVNVSSTPSIADIIGIRTILSNNRVPKDPRYLVMSPTTHDKYLALTTVNPAEVRGSAETITEGVISRFMGFNVVEDQNIATHALGTATSMGSATGTAGAATIALASVSGTTGTIKAGTAFTIADDTTQYVVTEDATAAAGAVAALKIYPNLAATCSGKTVTMQSDLVCNLAFNPQAFALVSRPLVVPDTMNGAVSRLTSPNMLPITVVCDWDNDSLSWIYTFQTLVAIKTIDPKLAVRLQD